MRRIEVRPIDRAAFAAFGTVIDPGGAAGESINDATTLRYSDLASLDVRGSHRDPVLSLYVAQARRFPLRIARLERHRQAAQVFLPLGLQRFVVVVAPGAQSPDWSRLQAFVTAPGNGVSLHRGCWHHGLIALGNGDRFAVIEGGNYREDTMEAEAPEPIEVMEPG
jgi:ureidoglycolate lyase